MKTKTMVLGLMAALAAALSPALAAEAAEAPFADVAADAWYAQGVAACAEAGIMIGDENGLFHPEQRLTQAECLTLALRLYAPGKEQEKAPEDWGRITLTLADGTALDGYGYGSYPLPGGEGGTYSLYWGSSTHNDPGRLSVRLEGDAAVCEAWGKAREGVATVSAGDRTVTGTATCWLPLGNWALSFYPDQGDGEEENSKIIQDTLYLDAPSPNFWYRDAYYTAQAWGLRDTEKTPGFVRLLDSVSAQWWATRDQFAAALADVAGGYDLTERVQVDDIPDETFEDGLYLKTLYEGGILNGVDEYGAFDGGAFLTRAQAAVMAARLLDEEQRLSEPVTPLPSDGYTLTETAETWDQVYGDFLEENDPYPAPKQGENELWGYVDRDGQWVIQPQWEEAMPFFDHYAVVWDGLYHYPIDQAGNLVVSRGYTALFNLGEANFFGEWLDGGQGYVREALDGAGKGVSATYGDMYLRFHNGYAVYQPFGTPKGFYIDDSFQPVSQKFDRCGALDEDHSGLVELDGKRYRIQFAQTDDSFPPA